MARDYKGLGNQVGNGVIEMVIPLVVNKNDENGNYVSSSEAKLFINDEPIARTLTCKCGGGQEVHHNNMVCVAMRGRNPEHPTDRTPGIHTEQRLEMNKDGLVNTLTTVQKDNLVLDIKCCRMVRTDEGKRLRKAYESHEIKCGFNEHRKLEPREDNIINSLTTVEKDNLCLEIKQATKDGVIKCKVGGCYDASYPDSKTRRGRVQNDGDVTPTITAQGGENINYVETEYRIRKLTPRECWRLMGYTDEDFDKAQAVVSNTQLYKQAGNAIVKQVLMAIFSQML